MAQLSPDRYYTQIESGAAGLADLLHSHGADLHIPTCPEWNLRQLVTHVGRAHRWAAQIVATRAVEVIPFRAVPDGALPAEPAERAQWLRAGAALLTGAARDAGDEVVWSFVGDVQPASGPAGWRPRPWSTWPMRGWPPARIRPWTRTWRRTPSMNGSAS